MADNDAVTFVESEKCSTEDLNLLAACAAFDKYNVSRQSLKDASLAARQASHVEFAASDLFGAAQIELFKAVEQLGGALIYKGHVVIAVGSGTVAVAKHHPDTIYSVDKDAK